MDRESPQRTQEGLSASRRRQHRSRKIHARAAAGEISLAPDASYVYLCTNNTIEGTQWTAFPETGAVPLVADMSSDIASRRADV